MWKPSSAPRPGRRRISILLLALVPAAAWREAAAADIMIAGTAGAKAGTAGIPVPILINNDQAIHAFSSALRFDPQVLTLIQVSHQDTAIASIQAEFFYSTINNTEGTAIIGSIFSYEPNPFDLIELPPSPEIAQPVAILFFDVAPGAPPGDYPLTLEDQLGDPPVSNIFSQAGTTIHPSLQMGAFTVDNENFFSFRETKVAVGSRFDVVVEAKHPKPLQGYSIAFTYDKSILTFISATWAGTDAARGIQPHQIEFFAPQIETDFSLTHARATIGAVLDFIEPFQSQEIPASADVFQSIARLTFEAVNDPALLDTATDLVFTDVAAPGSINNLVIADKASLTPDVIDGQVQFIEGILFQRGLVNDDRRLDISDGIFILSHLFQGDVGPTCVKAADLNDDGRFDISDAITLFTYLFIGGAEPGEPFGACGLDPTEDSLSCGIAPGCS